MRCHKELLRCSFPRSAWFWWISGFGLFIFLSAPANRTTEHKWMGSMMNFHLCIVWSIDLHVRIKKRDSKYHRRTSPSTGMFRWSYNGKSIIEKSHAFSTELFLLVFKVLALRASLSFTERLNELKRLWLQTHTPAHIWIELPLNRIDKMLNHSRAFDCSVYTNTYCRILWKVNSKASRFVYMK